MFSAFSLRIASFAFTEPAASITLRIVSPIRVALWLTPASVADCSATPATSFIVRSRSRDVAKISREVAPISVVVAAVSFAVACCSRDVAAISATDVVTCSDDCCARATSSGQLVGHPVEARLERAEFVAAAQVEAARQVAGAHHVVHLDEPRHRDGHRPVQQVAG